MLVTVSMEFCFAPVIVIATSVVCQSCLLFYKILVSRQLCMFIQSPS